MLRLPRLVAATLLSLAPGVAALQRGAGAPRPEHGEVTIALFAVRSAEGDVPLAVRFVDRSFGDITSWTWEFGDGQTSALQNPTHVYTEGGVYDVRLTITGPHGTDTLAKPGAVVARQCTSESARDNRIAPLERGEDFVPITGDDALGFYCVYSGKAIAADNPRLDNNVGMFVFPLANGEVLLFGSGYGDRNSFVEPTADANHDVRRVDAIIRFCLGREPAHTPIRFVTPHGHIDHINADCIRELRRRGYPIVEILFHSRDATWAKSMPGWTSVDRAVFRSLRNATDQCQEELLSYASPLGRIWFFLREGHTPGSIDLVIDVQGDPSNRFVVRGSGEIYGNCPLAGVRDAIEAHGNVRLGAPRPKVFALGPDSGSSFGATEVLVSGQDFTAALAGAPRVFFDGTPAGAVKVLSDDALTCVAPPGIPGERADIRVLNRNGQTVLAAAFLYRPLPTLDGVSPPRGVTSGGTRVTVTGSGFLGSAASSRVTFGGMPATAVQVIDDATLQCTTPPHALGSVRVALSNLDGAAELDAGFLYDPVIDVRSVTPATGSGLGGTRVQLTGSAFAVGAAVPEVFFGPARAGGVVRLGDTLLECTTPAGPAGSAVDVRVSGANGSDVLAGGFRYFEAPRITSVDPVSGSEAGGAQVTLTGSSFAKNNAGANRVKFGSLAATGVITVSDTVLRCTAPAGPGGTRVDVFVTNANGTGRLAEGYRYHRPPVLGAVAPDFGPRTGGTLVTLHGSAFQETGTGATTVRFGGAPALEVTPVDDTTLTCRTPAVPADGTVDVELSSANGHARLAGAFRYVTRPVLSVLEPTSGPARGGNAVTLRGGGFQAPGSGPTRVRFGSTSAERVRVLDDSTLTCEVPFGLPGTRSDVQVANQNGSARLAAGYQYLALPALTAVFPDSGKQLGGTRVSLSGAGFAEGGTPHVRFGSSAALDVVVRGDGRLECTTPPGAAGAVDVSLRTRGGTAVLREGFVYGSTRPTLGGLAPDHGPSLGSTLVELHGSGFVASLAGPNRVLFGGVQASSVVAVNDTLLRCAAPPGAPGALVEVRVQNANGGVALAAAYRYHLQPALASVTPPQGSSLGGYLVTLQGSGFVADGARDLLVRFGALTAGEIQVLDDGTLTCQVPPGGPGAGVDVLLANSNGSALLAQAFRYLTAPTLVAIAPSGGTPLGGTTVLLGGTGFALGGGGPTTVSFGAGAATQVTILADDALSCLAPAGAPGTSTDVILANANGVATLVQAYRYHAAPAIATLAPGNGPAAGGTTVVLTGSGFTASGAGTNVVTFGGRPARSVITVDDTRVRAVAPLGTAGASVDLVLANANGSAVVPLGFRYNALPALATLEPPGASAAGGTPVTLRGSGFQRDAPGVNSVLFGTIAAGGVSVLDDETLTCLAPAAPAGTEVVVSLSNRNGAASATEAFRYHPAPRIDELVPPFGFSGGGEWVEVRGAGWLANAAGANTVRFGAQQATEVTLVDDAVLRCRVPPGPPGPVSVEVENANGTVVLPDGFYYDWAPTLTGLQPGQGSPLGGTEVLLTGGGFAAVGAGLPSVRFGAGAATAVRVQDGQNLLCSAPAGPAGTSVSVVVSNTHGSASLGGFRYHPRPTIASVDPAQGPPGGGTPVTLRGTGFSANEAGPPVLRFDAADAGGITVVDDTTVVCIAPPGQVRTWPLITLANANGTASFADGFRWLTRDPGDLNDDGIGDALFSGTDAVYLFFGASSGLSDESTLSADLALRTAVTGSGFGAQVTAGDLNADQIADLVVTAPLDDVAGTDAGALFVFFGPLAASPTPRMASSASAVFRGAAAGDRFGTGVVVRDVTGDGDADLVVGAPFNDAAGSNGGAVYVYRGSTSFAGRTTAQATLRLLAASSEDSFGAALAAGDVTGEGRADVLVGAPLGGAGGSSGAAYVFRGGAGLVSGSGSDALVEISGQDSGDLLGTSLGAADFDGDGIEDLFVGAPDARNNGVQGGSVYYFRGGASLASGTADDAAARLDAESAGDRLGLVLALGDADGDGLADVLVGAPQHDVPASNAGRAYLVLGGALTTGSIAARADTLVLAESSPGDQLGAALALVDFDGDGLADLFVGAPFSNGGGTDSGRVHVIWGSALQATRSGGADDVTYTGASSALVLGREIGGSR